MVATFSIGNRAIAEYIAEVERLFKLAVHVVAEGPHGSCAGSCALSVNNEVAEVSLRVKERTLRGADSAATLTVMVDAQGRVLPCTSRTRHAVVRGHDSRDAVISAEGVALPEEDGKERVREEDAAHGDQCVGGFHLQVHDMVRAAQAR